MKIDSLPVDASLATLQTVLDRLAADPELSASRKRDLRSAVTSFATLLDQTPAAIPMDLAAIRRKLDTIEPAWAKVSRKRWSNLRSDLGGAIAASGLRPMLKTSLIEIDDGWRRLLTDAEPRIAHGLSRFARWASLRQIAPQAVDIKIIERFVAELGDATLVRKLRYIHSLVTKRWNELVASNSGCGLRPVSLEGHGRRVLKRIARNSFPASLWADVESSLQWASMPDPLAMEARARALRPRSLRLRREHIHSAASAAVAAGIPAAHLTSLAVLVQVETFRVILRQLWQQDGRKLSAYTHGVAVTLIALAGEWVKEPPEAVDILKGLRKKLGDLPPGLTEKNEGTLRSFDDPRLISALVHLPDRLWREARRSRSRYVFTAIQTAIAIDILIHVPFRMQNLSAINFDEHLHWPQGPRKPALIRFGRQDTKNEGYLKFELPIALAARLQVYRDEIAPGIIGRKPGMLFVTSRGKVRSQEAVANAIKRSVLRNLGVKVTPHQFRHLCAKIILDDNPGALPLVQEMLGHSSEKTTRKFYAGINTLRAGRAHAELVNELRESNLGRRRRRPHRTKD